MLSERCHANTRRPELQESSQHQQLDTLHGAWQSRTAKSCSTTMQCRTRSIRRRLMRTYGGRVASFQIRLVSWIYAGKKGLFFACARVWRVGSCGSNEAFWCSVLSLHHTQQSSNWNINVVTLITRLNLSQRNSEYQQTFL